MALALKSSFTYSVTHRLCSNKRGTAQGCQKVFLIYLYNPLCRKMNLMSQTPQQGRSQWFNIAERMVIMRIIKLQKHRWAILWKWRTSSGLYLVQLCRPLWKQSPFCPAFCQLLAFFLLIIRPYLKLIKHCFWLIILLCRMQLKVTNFPSLRTRHKAFTVRKMLVSQTS